MKWDKVTRERTDSFSREPRLQNLLYRRTPENRRASFCNTLSSGTENAPIPKMLRTVETEDPTVSAGTSGVKSTLGQGTETKAFMLRRNLLSLLENFGRFARDVAVVETRGYRREKLTYGELATRARLWSRALGARGIAPGDRVLLWGGNSAEWVACFWGILLRGAVVVPMEGTASPDFVERAIEDSSVKLVVRDLELAELPGAPPSLLLNDLKADAPGRGPGAKTEVDPGERSTRSTIAEILYTSGTTSEPRGVVLTHGNFLANLEPLERGIGEYRKYERWFHPLGFLTLVPLTHVFGQFMALFVPPLLGAAVVFEPSGNPAEIVRAVKRERSTALVAVPRMLDLLKAGLEREWESGKKQRWFARTLEQARGKKFLRRAWIFRPIHRRFGWKFWAFISGGAALAEDTESFFRRMGYAVVQGYGMTETASLVSLNHPFRATEGSVGKILPGLECKLAGDGEILVRGENVAAGYWKKGVLLPSGEGGWLRTGDLGEVDAQGNLRFRGRKKNVIVTPAGLNIYPEDLESALRRQRGVRDCVVIPFERGGNAEPCAVLLMGDSSEAATRDAVERANSSLAEYQRIPRWLPWPEPDFPRTSTGKPRLPVIAARAAQILDGRRASGLRGGKSHSWDALLARFGQTAAPSGSLEKSLNLSSLDRVALMSELEETFHVELSETAFAQAKTLADVERLLAEPSFRREEYRYPRWAQREPVRWLRLAVYYALAWPATEILGHPRIVGRENLGDLRGPLLVISNHITRRADIGLILRALPGRFRHRLAAAMGAETLENMRRPPQEWFFAKRWAYQLGYWLVTAIFNVFPLPQFSGFRESFRFAGETVDRGFSVLLFPEGVVNNSLDGRMAPFQSGIGLLAENLRIPILPMRLDGVWQMKRERRRLARFGEITVRIGRPVAFAPGTPPERIARELEAVVKSL